MIQARRSHGTHLLIDLWGARHLEDADRIRETMINAALRAGAKLLHVHLHKFEPHGGVTGVALLAESHISIHTWPESSYAALDVFMCGSAEPERTIPIIKATFTPRQTIVLQAIRGTDGGGSSMIETASFAHCDGLRTGPTTAQARG
ncbi:MULTISPECIES: adenosylmethionine decarboxylase [Bradyrhizobium]|uniref:S-adenosylmethionine decarboxylase proenzyme n=1 Tax=Bradyrhizobium arachidis TaxID=858423 RepID=A0AAE7P0R1_9BRAD|nr:MULTISPECIES: adenosylmethionine decarboxylase [Bradyrhizobium]QOZ73290.1 adenosylmethionine decarboxylase [Bradyrhizobium arachidis]